MTESKIFPITQKINVKFSGKKVVLPKDIQNKIDAYWDGLMAEGKNYARGEVFTVTDKNITEDEINILVEKTDYAHFVYCQNVDDLGELGIRIIYPGALVETLDGYFVFGKMGNQTARAGIIQLSGGGINNNDLKGDYFDLNHSIKKELSEELGIEVDDSSRVKYFKEAYFKDEGGEKINKMAVVYRVKLNETKDEFFKKYDQFVVELKERNELPEFGEIIFLKKDKSEIQNFLNQKDIALEECMRPLFKHFQANL